MSSSAVISDDGLYRFELRRDVGIAPVWQMEPRSVTWMMLNPSTADADVNDATIRRCMDFSGRWWGYEEMIVVNLMPIREVNPRRAKKAHAVTPQDVIDENLRYVRSAVMESKETILAWGSAGAGPLAWAVWEVLRNLRRQNVSALGWTKNHQPSHPLYLKRSTERSLVVY